MTLSGRYFSKKEIVAIQQTVRTFPGLSMTELAPTVCEHIAWTTAPGKNKIRSCFTALEKLDTLGYIPLPAKRQQKMRVTKKMVGSKRTEPLAPVECTLDELGILECPLVIAKTDVARWNE